jgi:hypothetical protein
MKKNLSLALLSLTLIISSQLGAIAEVSQNNTQLAVLRGIFVCTVSDPTGTPLNVRATPNGRIIGSLSNGTRVQVSRGTSGRWRKVFTEYGEGYVLNAYLSNCLTSQPQ